VEVLVSPAAQTVNVGAAVSVQVRLNTNGLGVCQGGVFLQFDTARLQFVGGENSTATWNSTLFNVEPDQRETGIISLNVGGASPVNGDDVLISTLNFTALSGGSSDLTLLFNADREETQFFAADCFTPLTTDRTGGAVDIQAPGTTPTDTPAVTNTTTAAPTATSTVTPANTLLPTATTTGIPSVTGTPEPSATATSTATPANTSLPSATMTGIPSATGTPELPPSQTATASASAVPTAAATVTSTVSTTQTATPAGSRTSSATSTPTPTPTSTPLPENDAGDANCDERVTAADLPAVVSAVQQNGPAICGIDANRDGRLDQADIAATISQLFAR
jgi:hypothetical protein